MEISDLSLVLDTSAHTLWHPKSNNFVAKSYKGISKAPSEYHVLSCLQNASTNASKQFPEQIVVSITVPITIGVFRSKKADIYPKAL